MVDFLKYDTPDAPLEPVEPAPVDLSATVNVDAGPPPPDFTKYDEPDVPGPDPTVHRAVVGSTTPQQEAEITGISQRTGMPQDVVRSGLPAAQTKDAHGKLLQDLTGAPILSNFLKNPTNLAATYDDVPALAAVEELSPWEKFKSTFEDIPGGFRRGQDVVTRGTLYSELSNAILTGGDQTDIMERIKTFEDGADPSVSNRGFLESAAEMLPMIGASILAGQEEGLKYATVGATGALVAGQIGPQAALPEEVLTVPAAAATMYAAGTRVGAVNEIFNLERGNALAEFLAVTDETGAPLNPAIANIVALGVGGINAGLEFTGLKYISKILPKGAQDALIGRLTTDAAKKALRDPSVRRALLDVAKRYTTGVGTETLTEMGQEAVNILGEAVAKWASDQDFAEEELLSPENVARVMGAGEMAFKATVVLGGAGAGVSTVRDVRTERKKIADAEAFSAQQMELSDRIANTATAAQNPAMMEKFLNDEMGLRDQDAYVDSEVIMELAQTNPVLLDEIASSMGAKTQSVVEAANQGRPIRMNLGAYHSRLSPEAKSALFNGLKATPGAYSAAQVEEGLAQTTDNFEDQYTGFIEENQAISDQVVRIEQESLAAGADPRVAAQTAQISARMAMSIADNSLEGSAASIMEKIQFAPQDIRAANAAAAKAKVFDQAQSAVSFDTWSQGAPVIEGADINYDTAEGSKVYKVAHGTTHAFNVFDPSVTGNKEGQFGAVNYFTSDPGDADANYAGRGPDLTSRIESLADNLVNLDLEGLQDWMYEQGLDLDMAAAVVDNYTALEQIAKEQLEGVDPQTLELFVRLDNPAYVGGDTVTWINSDVTEQYREDATEDILEENDATEDQVDEFEDEIQERMYDYASNDENPIHEAVRDAIQDFENDVNAADVIGEIADVLYDSEVTATDLEDALRNSATLQEATDYDSPTGENVANHIIGQVFKNLGFDGIVLQNADQRFANMDMGGNTAHVHVFEETPSQIKARANETFDPTNPDIYQQVDKLDPALAGTLLNNDEINELIGLNSAFNAGSLPDAADQARLSELKSVLPDLKNEFYKLNETASGIELVDTRTGGIVKNYPQALRNRAEAELAKLSGSNTLWDAIQEVRAPAPSVDQQIDKLDPSLAGGLGVSAEGIPTFDPVKAALGNAKTFYQGIASPGVGGRFLRGQAGVQDNMGIVAELLGDDIINAFDGVKTIEEARQWADSITWLNPTVVTTTEEVEAAQAPGFQKGKKLSTKLMRWGKQIAKGYEELGKAFYGNDKMKYPNAIYPHGRNTWDIPGCGRESWAVMNGIDITQACYGGACYAEAITKAKQGLAAGVASGVKVKPLTDKVLRAEMNAFFKKNGLEKTQQKWPDYQVKENTTKSSKNFGKLSIGIVTEALPAAVVSTKLQAAKGADIRLGVDTDGAAWLSDTRSMDAILKADPRTLTVYSSAYHNPPPPHALSGRTIINVTVSGWHPLPETLSRIKWAEQARANGWNVILREVVADEVTFDKATSNQYNRLHEALLQTDFFVMLQPLHIGALHGTTIDNMPGCCVGTETNQHTCDQCEVAEGLGKGFQEYWEIHEERDPTGGEIVLPDSDYEGRTLYQETQGQVQVFDDKYLISLFENANESTPFHELGHTFLAEMQSIVDRDAGTPQLVEDMMDIGNWLDTLNDPDFFADQFNKYPPTAFVGRALDSLTPVEMEHARETLRHEYFARGFEAYLMEGKAPSPELIPAFRRFARWLKSIYKNISGLDVKLNPRVRDIFDRMLQSEVEVEDAMSEAGLEPMTKAELDLLGVLPEDRDYLKRLHQDAQTEAEILLTRARLAGSRQRRPEWAEKADDMIQRSMLNATVNRLKKGKGVDRQTSIETWGREVIDRMPKGLKKIFKKGGQMPDEVAYEEGYRTAEDMFNALEGWIPEDQQKRRYIAARQLEYQNSLKAEDFVIDTKEFAEYLGIIGNYTAGKMGESAQLEESLTGRKGSKAVLARSAFKKYAKTIIRDMPLRDATRLDLFIGAMKRAAQGEAAAIKRGDWAAAQKANEQMRLNFEMAQESRRIIAEKEKAERFAKRTKKAKADKVAKEYLGAALKLGQRFGLVKLNEGHTPLLEAAGDISSLMVDESDMMGPDEYGFSTELMEGTAPFDYRDLNADELNEVHVLMKALVKKGRDAIDPKLTSLDIRLEEAKEDLVLATSTLTSKTKWKKRGRTFFGMDPVAWLRRAQDFTRKIYADTFHMWSMLRILDGFTYYRKDQKQGPFETYFRDNLERAYGLKDQLTHKYEPQIRAAMTTLFKRGSNQKKMALWLDGLIPVPPPKTLTDDGLRWNFEAVAAVALNIGNESNLTRLKEGYGWTDDDISGIVSVMNAEEWAAVQELWDIFEDMRPDFFAASERIHGVAPPRIEPRPFVTPTGVSLRGGYVPAVYSRSNVRAAELDDRMILKETANAGHQRASVNARATKSRAVTAGGMPIRLDLSGISRQFDYNLQYTAFAETIRDLSRVLNNQEVADAISDKVGEEWLPAMRIILSHVADPGAGGTTDVISNMLKGLGSTASKFILGLNRSVGVKQVFSIPALWVEKGSWFGGFSTVIRNPNKAWVDMLEESTFMRQRMEGTNIDREVGRVRRELNAQNKLSTAVWEFVDEALFAFIRMFDAIATFPAYYGTKRKMERKYGPGAKAIRETEKIISDTQPVSRAVDMSRVQLNRHGLARLMTLFTGFTMKFENRKRVYVRGFLEGEIPARDFMTHVMLERILPPLMMNLLFTFGYGDDPEAEDIAWDILLYQVCGFPVVRELVVGAANMVRQGTDEDFRGFSPINTPLLATYEAIERNTQTLARWFRGDEDDFEAWVAAIEAVLALKGVPAVKVARELDESIRQFKHSRGPDAAFKLLVKPDPKERE